MYRTHEMRMIRAEESGVEEWACPTCGRRMLLRWPPDHGKRIIEPGDEKADHIASADDDTPPPTAQTPNTADIAQRHHSRHRWLRETGVKNASPHVTPP